MESLVLSGAPDAPIITKPEALALSQSFVVPSIEVVLSKPSNTGVPLQPSVFFDVVDSPCVHSSLSLMLCSCLSWYVLSLNIDLNQ